MIFVTLGSQKFQFDRLLIQIDELVEAGLIREPLFAQAGASDYLPKHYPYQRFLDRADFDAALENCDLVITHGGTGTILDAVQRGKKVIAVPRLAKYGEHVDDHQIQIITQFDKMDLICPCMDPKELAGALETVKMRRYRSYQSNTGVIAAAIEEFLSRL